MFALPLSASSRLIFSLAQENRRQLLQQYLDVDAFLNYIVIFNYAGTWDQNFHNQFITQRISDGKWAWHPWDGDRLYGEFYNYTAADIYAGDVVEYHLLKRSVIQNFKPELDERYVRPKCTWVSMRNCLSVSSKPRFITRHECTLLWTTLPRAST